MISTVIAFVNHPQNPAQEGTDVIFVMLITGLVFLATIALGELVAWAGHRKHDRKQRAARTDAMARFVAEPSSPSSKRSTALFPRNTKIEALGRVPLFSGFSKRELGELAKIADDLEIPAGRTIGTEGTRGREFFAIVEGEVELTKKGKRVKTLVPGDFCGEFALIVGSPRLTTATAKTPVRVFVLTDRHFKQVLRAHPGVELKVMRSLVEWLSRVVNDPALTG